MTARIKDINAATEVEILAPRTIINWNPIDGTGNVQFEKAAFYRTKSGDYFGQPQPCGGRSLSLQEVIELGPMAGVDPLAVVVYLKTLFDFLENREGA